MPLNIASATKANKQMFIRQVAKEGKLEELRKSLGPLETSREIFDQLIALPLEDIRTKIRNMKRNDIQKLCEANGISYMKKPTKMAKTTDKAIDKIMEQLEQMKLSDHY